MAKCNFNSQHMSNQTPLHQLLAEGEKRLAERLDYIKLSPRVVLDLSVPGSASNDILYQLYPKSRIINGLTPPMSMLDSACQLQRARGKNCVRIALPNLPLQDHSVDLVFSNMGLLWLLDTQTLFDEIRRTLTPNGLVMFTSLGPDTLIEARQAWAQVDNALHINQFTDMHHLGDQMTQVGLNDPVTDAEWLTFHYSDPCYLLYDLKAVGSFILAAEQKSQAIVGPKTLDHYSQAYSEQKVGGVYPATFELVYGHAWGNSLPTAKQTETDTFISASSLKKLIKRF
jgi:malonyl-CoA O-methyltransferase